MSSSTTLLSFVGARPPKTVRYRLDDGVEFETSLFAVAVIDWLRRTGRPATRWVVLGTTSSAWAGLAEAVARLAPRHGAAAAAWAESGSTASRGGAVARDLLDEFERRFSEPLGIELRLMIGSNDGDDVFAALDSAIEPDASVVLDVTSSFRSMPIHAIIALGALRWIKGVEIADVLYGSLDEGSDGGATPTRSLAASARLARATPALARLALDDDVDGVAGFFGESDPVLASDLRETQRLESLMLYRTSAAPRERAIERLSTTARDSASAIERSCAARTKAALDSLRPRASGSGTDAGELRQRAESALRRGDFMRALGLANEALIARIVERHGLRRAARDEFDASTEPDRNFYRILNRRARRALWSVAREPSAPNRPGRSATALLGTLADLRNAVMHAGGESTGGSALPEIGSAEELADLIRWSLEFHDSLA